MNLNAHLSELPAAEAAAFRTLVARLQAAPQREPSPQLASRILAAVASERTRNPKPETRNPKPETRNLPAYSTHSRVRRISQRPGCHCLQRRPYASTVSTQHPSIQTRSSRSCQ